MQILSDKMEQYGQFIADGKLDFIIAGYGDFNDRQCDSVLLSERNLFLCVAPDHPLASRESIYLKEIENEPYIDLSPGLPFRSFCDRVFQQAGVKMNTVIECNYEMRPRLVLGGYGVAVTSTGKSVKSFFKGSAFIPINDEAAVRKIGLFWKKDRAFTPVMQLFHDYMMDILYRKK
jgi:DNA-binding transcriptional LysR family regulator